MTLECIHNLVRKLSDNDHPSICLLNINNKRQSLFLINHEKVGHISLLYNSTSSESEETNHDQQ